MENKIDKISDSYCFNRNCAGYVKPAKTMNKSGQISVFIIVAFLIAAGIVLFFLFSNTVGVGGIPEELAPVFDYYQGCVKQEAKNAIELAETQGGYVDVPDYFPGSEYAPFSSQLNFLGFPVPYWYYVSGNGLIKEQIPSKSEIESDIESYVKEGLSYCDFEPFYAKGFLIEKGDPEVRVDILDEKVVVDVSADLVVSKGDVSARKSRHTAEVSSKFGKFYNLAVEIYQKQKSEAFFEDYAVDVLRLYAPVDNVAIQCAPKVWSTRNVISNLKTGLEENFRTIKFKGSYYELGDKEREYFILDKDVDEAVNVIYSKNWPTKVEVVGDGVSDEVMVAESVGTQEGMGIMGFCYVPYHYVYDLSFPVLVQIYNNDELFQFPVIVIIDKNVPRKAEFSESILGEEEEFDLCEFKTQEIEVNLFDLNLNKIDANLSYECLNQKCRLGQSKDGVYKGFAPACVNGYLHVRAGGYEEKKQLFSSNSEKFADVIVQKEFDVKINVSVSGRELEDSAIVSFVKKNGKSSSVVLPGMNSVKLSEGSYEIRVYVYGNSSVVLPESSRLKCVDVPKGGLLGFFGGTEEECFDVTIPKTRIEQALIGGGVSDTYLLESELDKGSAVVKVESLPAPNSIDDLQNNFERFETMGVDLVFKDEN